MKLTENLGNGRTRVDSITQLNIEPNQITVMIKSEHKINDETYKTECDFSHSFKFDLTNIQNRSLWETLEDKILQAKLLSSNSNTTLSPDYKRFYDSLLGSEIFQYVRTRAGFSNEHNLAYTDFISALSLCITGQGNPIALQSACNNLLQLIPLPSNLITQLKSFIKKNNIPLTLN